MSDSHGFTALRVGQAIPKADVAQLSLAEFRRAVAGAVSAGQRVAALFGDGPGAAGSVDLYAVLADSGRARVRLGKTRLDSDSFPSTRPIAPRLTSSSGRSRSSSACAPKGTRGSSPSASTRPTGRATTPGAEGPGKLPWSASPTFTAVLCAISSHSNAENRRENEGSEQ